MSVLNLYGRICGRKLSPRLQFVYEHILPLVDCTHKVLEKRDDVFSTDESWWMEIGFGDGSHLRAQMKKHAQVHFLGVEVFRPGIVRCLINLSQEEQNRLHIFPHSVHLLLPHLPRALFEKIFILFPDPWPKQRHHKRRLLQSSFLTECWKILKNNGQLVIASDVQLFIHWMQQQLKAHSGFEYAEGAQTSNPEDWPEWPQTLPLSAYARKALCKTYFVWKKLSSWRELN
ncbi:tRNA (guanine-N(7)-)-methyltransferase [Holospora obtusa F1]|uniref:tRNA (guanine(46)-N(7))-methyltransferase n=1 Tax=Holospora obtusa F1 TaxID=1399147 RepID=W6TI05_HOLOB|nr:tRNA (guanosine(46)-N7)-methyltransferase TrmB [Holospora obtusa]ETZ07620.1 tRNA (guanine-N(7)-)-methyltransferase [Holospora obtusa F1]